MEASRIRENIEKKPNRSFKNKKRKSEEKSNGSFKN